MSAWFASKCECRACGHRVVAVFPEEADPDTLECAHCGHFTSEAVEYIPPKPKDVDIFLMGLFQGSGDS
ncbi:MAG: hypothetical protein AMXMBFR84_49540 [Candidatus Hydrogenedentota bacterium]